MHGSTENLDDYAPLVLLAAMASVIRRPEGFSGQTQVVVPGPTRRMLARHPLLRGLFVTDAGFYPRAAGHWVERPAGSPTHLLIACLRGRGWVRSNGRTWPMERGDIVALPANQPHSYGAHDDAPWSIAWVHFMGDESEAWLEFSVGRMGAASACHVPPERLDSLGIDRMHLVLEQGYGLRQLVEAASSLRLALTTLSRLRVQTAAAVSAQERVAATVARVQQDFQSSIRVPELAAAAGLSVTHFTALFREQTGYPPTDYLIRVRVQRGAHLLATSLSSIGDIATLSGFADSFYFTRCFKRIMGCSPRAYREAISGQRSAVSESRSRERQRAERGKR